jgi:hypothetical protein
MDNGTDKRGSLDEQSELVDAYIKLMGVSYTLDIMRVDETVDDLSWRISFINLSNNLTIIAQQFAYKSKNNAIISAEHFIRNWVIHNVLNKTTTKGE